jgi:hypothetical protein
MNVDIFSGIMILFVILISYRIYRQSDTFQLKCILSTIDGNKYCVRERNNSQLSADILANVNKNLQDIINYCDNKYPDKDCVLRMKKGFNPKKIIETLPTSEYTAYSENKGEKLAFCLDTKKNVQGKLIDLNTLTYVAIHELAHVATESVGHTPEFWKNFKFLLTAAKEANIYKPVDYKNKPQEYCGMTINDNPYFDN